MIKLYQLTTRMYCAGLIVEYDKVLRAAPILKWTIGKHENWVKHYCKKHNIKLELVQETKNARTDED